MGKVFSLISKLKLFAVVLLGVGLPSFALSQNETSFPPKSFAVFVAKYNLKNDLAEGGVAGTAFFISPTRAVTAFHVLQSASFEQKHGFERIRIWLVHENRPAIEVKPKDLHEMKDSDLTIIDFKQVVAMSDELYMLAQETPHAVPDGEFAKAEFTTEGFLANSVGPILVRQGLDLQVVGVPRLQRLNTSGFFLQAAKVELKSLDVSLRETPCLKVSYLPVVGLSGGPLLRQGQVIGVNSFADPSQKATWAVAVQALVDHP